MRVPLPSGSQGGGPRAERKVDFGRSYRHPAPTAPQGAWGMATSWGGAPGLDLPASGRARATGAAGAATGPQRGGGPRHAGGSWRAVPEVEEVAGGSSSAACGYPVHRTQWAGQQPIPRAPAGPGGPGAAGAAAAAGAGAAAGPYAPGPVPLRPGGGGAAMKGAVEAAQDAAGRWVEKGRQRSGRIAARGAGGRRP